MKTLTFRGCELRVWTVEGVDYVLVADVSKMTNYSLACIHPILSRMPPQTTIQIPTRELGLIGREARGRPRTLITYQGLDVLMRVVPWPYADLFRKWASLGFPSDFDAELRTEPTVTEKVWQELGETLARLPHSEVTPDARILIRLAIERATGIPAP